MWTAGCSKESDDHDPPGTVQVQEEDPYERTFSGSGQLGRSRVTFDGKIRAVNAKDKQGNDDVGIWVYVDGPTGQAPDKAELVWDGRVLRGSSPPKRHPDRSDTQRHEFVYDCRPYHGQPPDELPEGVHDAEVVLSDTETGDRWPVIDARVKVKIDKTKPTNDGLCKLEFLPSP